ncbi:MAG: bifunctional DNA primase/polymerase [Anaerolineae bacterium]|nr:bifunctional DNA primase/polymerase [Anaerolineae bacterium]
MSQAPTRTMIDLAAVPTELKALRQWVCWRYETRKGSPKPTKVPYTPDGDKAESNNPDTWRAFDVCAFLWAEGKCDGIGIVLDGGLAGIDLDDCIENGALSPLAQEIVDEINTYTEITPSGAGLHLLMWGKLPEGRRRDDALRIEAYDVGRFFTYTGRRLDGTPQTVERRDSQLAAVHARILPPRARPAASVPPGTLLPDDQDLLAKARGARNGAKFDALWSGSTSMHNGDHSAADLALCNILAFWCGGDTGQMDRLFRQSGLYRPKWDERHSADGHSYGQMTIGRAVGDAGGFYIPKPDRANGHESATPQKTQTKSAPAALRAPLLCPPLPEYARLTQEQEALAATTGRWLDEYIAFACEASPMTPQPFHVAAGLALGSLVIARRVRVDVATEKIFPNLYMLYIGPSTVQRKSTAFRTMRGLLKAADLSHFLLADRQTTEGFSLDLTTRMPPSYDTWETTVKDIWLKERSIAAQRAWLLEEASHLLDSFRRDFTAGLLPIVLDLYDSPEQAITSNTISRGRGMINNSYLTIFGVTTYGAMADHLNNKVLWNNGFFGRFSLVGSDDVGTWRFWPEPMCYPVNLVQRLRFVATQLLTIPIAYLEETEIIDTDGTPRKNRQVELSTELVCSKCVIERDGPTWQAWERYAKAVSFDMLNDNQISEKLKPSYGRAGTMAFKVALILATFDTEQLPVIVEPRHIYRAQQILETWRANLHGIFANLQTTQADDTANQIKIALARAGGEWVTQRDLVRGMGTKLADIKNDLEDLVETGEIEQKEEKNDRGRATVSYKLLLPTEGGK